MHSRKSLLFNKNVAWVKKDNSSLFDVTIGSFDGAEVCELVGLYILDKLTTKYGKKHIGLYRDDGLAAFNTNSGPQMERIKKDITAIFKSFDLKIVIKTNLKIVDFLDVTFDLSNESYYPYKKPNDEPLCINSMSNHPPSITKHLPAAINRRISDLSWNKEAFERAKPYYEKVLKSCGYKENMSYISEIPPSTGKRNRQRKIIWFNPPFNQNVQTNVAKVFLTLVAKHFQKSHKFSKIFNKNNVKVSYSCMENISDVIKKHNKKVLYSDQKKQQEGCNCRKKDQCPLQGKCLTTNVIYNAEVVSDQNTINKNHFGLTEGTFKQRYYKHNLSFRDRKYAHSTELSKHIWQMRDADQIANVNWSVVTTAKPNAVICA